MNSTETDRTRRASLAAAARMELAGHLDGLTVSIGVNSQGVQILIHGDNAEAAQALAAALGVTAYRWSGQFHNWSGAWHGAEVEVSSNGTLPHPEPVGENDAALKILAAEAVAS